MPITERELTALISGIVTTIRTEVVQELSALAAREESATLAIHQQMAALLTRLAAAEHESTRLGERLLELEAQAAAAHSDLGFPRAAD